MSSSIIQKLLLPPSKTKSCKTQFLQFGVFRPSFLSKNPKIKDKKVGFFPATIHVLTLLIAKKHGRGKDREKRRAKDFWHSLFLSLRVLLTLPFWPPSSRFVFPSFCGPEWLCRATTTQPQPLALSPYCVRTTSSHSASSQHCSREKERKSFVKLFFSH